MDAADVVTSGVADAVSVRGGVAGLAIAAVLALLGAAVRRLDRGDTAAMDSLRDLNSRLVLERDRADTAREKADSEADRERDRASRLEEYARSLEDRLGIPHRDWP